MTNLRDEIDRRLASNQVYYAHFVTEQDFPRIRKDTTNDILKLFEERIDELLPDGDYQLITKGRIKEMLKK